MPDHERTVERVDHLVRGVPCVSADSVEHRHVDPAMIESEMPDDVENSSLQAATSGGGAREDSVATSSVIEDYQEDEEDDEEEEQEEDEGKNESERSRGDFPRKSSSSRALASEMTTFARVRRKKD